MLALVRVMGWTNFAVLVFSLMTAKGAGFFPVAFVYLSFTVCCLGMVIYHCFFDSLFNTSNKKEAIIYFVPYRLGIIIFVIVYVIMGTVMLYDQLF
ncbi:hypothetical protein CWB99_22240 [Pseudoalteromonas rubra]|uniref:Uncharacterized protein n=1 Tax=Pseudoalteromonas rubra TaxID=43658 RepID=A0A5S3WGB5_9GAMM|nr:hypothetical protein [Pseudoalteromonas rubra]TMP24464.1 hypothetical protein CWB99_22240 [Pseudoalteromonas rubra]TMP33295.1 hypothetical protein CWC00_11000 [Pseudoalteromonas rubra]